MRGTENDGLANYVFYYGTDSSGVSPTLTDGGC
jgi:hypothetical protein